MRVQLLRSLLLLGCLARAAPILDRELASLGSTVAGGGLTLELVNNLDNDNVHAYILGANGDGDTVLLNRDSILATPSATPGIQGSIGPEFGHPLGPPNSTTSIIFPTDQDILGARIYVAAGELGLFVQASDQAPTPNIVQPSVVNPADPNIELNWSFLEFTLRSPGSGSFDIGINPTFVDFYGLPLPFSVLEGNGDVRSIPAPPADAAGILCGRLQQQSRKDGQPWNELCVHDQAGEVLRVLSPSSLIASQKSAFEGYFSRYGRYCWDRYAHTPLTIVTELGARNCTVIDELLMCDGDNRGYALPTAAEIFSCDGGPFAFQSGDNAVHYAVVPRLCASLNRATLFLPDGDIQPGPPPESYYEAHPTNNYAKFVHELQQIGYAFPYDDVSPSPSMDQSGYIETTNPLKITIYVGGSGNEGPREGASSSRALN